MKTLHIPLLVLLAGLFTTGCRSNQVNHELLTRELRLLENQIYGLEDELNESLTKLDSCRRENATLRSRLHNRVEDDRDALEDGGNLPPDVELPAAPPYEGTPDIRPPDSSPPPEDKSPEDQSFSEINRLSRKVTASRLTRVERPDRRSEDADWLVEEIRLNPLLTGGHNVDRHVGDEGLLIVIEPRNASGEVIDVPGDVSIAVFDRRRTGGDQRIARWDFTWQEVADLFRTGPIGRGVHLDLRWASELPRHEDLEVVARYTRYDGEKLFAEKNIKIDVPQEVADHWKSAANSMDDQMAYHGRRDEPYEDFEPGPDLAPPHTVAQESYEQLAEDKHAPAPPPPTRVAQNTAEPRKVETKETQQESGPRGRPKWTPYR